LVKSVAKNSPELLQKIKGFVKTEQGFIDMSKLVFPKGTLNPADPRKMEIAKKTLSQMGIEGKEAEEMIRQAAQASASGGVATKAVDQALARRAKELKGVAPEVKALETGAKTGTEAAANVVKTAAEDAKKLGPSIADKFRKGGEYLKKYSTTAFERLKGIKSKLNLKNLVLYGLAGYGAYEVLKNLFSGSDAEKSAVMPDCVVNMEGLEWGATSGGDAMIFSKNEFDEASKGHGGLKFYPNMRVWTMDNAMSGTYACKAGGGVETKPLSENELNEQSSNITITWDKKDGETPPPPKPPKSNFHDCSNKELPHEFGCRSKQVKEVQVCLGLPEKYQTGNFGPITKKALEDKGIDTSNGLTQSIIDSVCNGADEEVVKKREQIKLEPLAPRDIKLKPIDLSNLKLPDIKPLEVSPAKFYNALKDNGNIVGEDDNNRIKYKGPDLDDTQLGRLDTALSEMGYVRIKQKDKDYGVKYVWQKQ